MATNEVPSILCEDSPEVMEYKTFDDMELPMELLRGIYAYGFEKPSEIQRKGIVPIAKGQDLIAQAQSGTGKTGTFTIGSLARVDVAVKHVQVLCLVPTRELAQQWQQVRQLPPEQRRALAESGKPAQPMPAAWG